MDSSIFKGMISNAALLLSLSFVYEIRHIIPAKYNKLIPYINGLLISILCIGVMSMPFELIPGLFFDTRTILIGVTAAMFGGVATGIAVCITVAYRAMLGGIGVWMGILSIVSSAVIGLIWRRRFLKRKNQNVWLSAYLMGLAIHVAMLACTLMLPWPLSMQTLGRILLPVMLIYPVGTVMLSLLLIWQKERKESSKRVAEAEERYRSLFENSNAATLIIDPGNGQIIDANEAACRLYGWNHEQIKKINLSAISMLDSGEIARHMQHFADETCKYRLFKQRKANGELMDVEVYSGPIHINGKKYLYSIIHDITSRIAADLKLKESEGRLRSAQAIAHVGNWELDLGKDLVWASEESFAIYGFEYEPANPYIPLQKIVAATSPADQPALSRAFQALTQRNEPYDVEFSIIRATDEETRYIHSIARLERVQDGKPIKLLGVVQDITPRKRAELELSTSETKHREMIANIADVITIAKPDGTLKYVSPNNVKWFGFQHEEVIGANGWNYVHPDDVPRLSARFAALTETDRKTDTVQCRFVCKNGEYRIVDLTAINMLGDPVIGGILMNYHDVTERTLAQMEYRAMLQATLDSFCIISSSGKFLDVNDAYCTLLGYTRNELLERSVADVEAAIDRADLPGRFAAVLGMGRARFESKHRCKSGAIVDVEVSCNVIPGSSGRICAFLRDITDRKKHQDEIEYINCHDTLTGLYNRAFFEEELRREDASGRLPICVIMGDINGLKLTNDIFGHTQGDKLLKAIADILKGCCRSDDIITRVGGDEFCILLPDTGKAAALAICERIYRACEESEVSAGGKPFHPSISLGCAVKTASGQPIESVLKDAEDSMYKRKLLERKSMHSSLVASIKATMLEKSHETKEHADRLIHLCRLIGSRMNLGSDQLDELELLAALHDIGKIGINEHILESKHPLTGEQWVEMKKHPEIGYRIALASPELVPIANYILYHHERWDGSGYPQKLKGDRIPLPARILAVADAYDAMTSDRPYRAAMPKEAAVREIGDNSGSQFDPEVVRVFLDTVA